MEQIKWNITLNKSPGAFRKPPKSIHSWRTARLKLLVPRTYSITSVFVWRAGKRALCCILAQFVQYRPRLWNCLRRHLKRIRSASTGSLQRCDCGKLCQYNHFPQSSFRQSWTVKWRYCHYKEARRSWKTYRHLCVWPHNICG